MNKNKKRNNISCISKQKKMKKKFMNYKKEKISLLSKQKRTKKC